jgi:hypothetical protein
MNLKFSQVRRTADAVLPGTVWRVSGSAAAEQLLAAAEQRFGKIKAWRITKNTVHRADCADPRCVIQVEL